MAGNTKKRRIAINALSATIGGGVTYLQNLIPALAKIDNDSEYYIFASLENYKNIFGSVNIPKNVKIIKISTINLLFRLILEQFFLPIIILLYRIDLIICPTNILTFMAPCRKMLWILNIYMYYDLDITNDSFYERIRFRLLRLLTTLSIKHSPLTIHISEYSKVTLSKMLGADDRKAHFIHLGVKIDKFSKKDDGVGGGDNKYILSVSSISERKNYKMLIKAYNDLIPGLQSKYKLVLIGNVTNEMKMHLYGHANKLLHDRIIFLGAIDFKNLCEAYKNASLFVFPSLVEAFGIPVIEAMAAGVPVLVSNNTALPEIAGNAGLTFNPYDAADLTQKIEYILSNEQLAEKLSIFGKQRVKSFTWENTAKQTLLSIDRLMKNEN